MLDVVVCLRVIENLVLFLSELAMCLGVQIHKLKDNWIIKLSTIRS